MNPLNQDNRIDISEKNDEVEKLELDLGKDQPLNKAKLQIGSMKIPIYALLIATLLVILVIGSFLFRFWRDDLSMVDAEREHLDTLEMRETQKSAPEYRYVFEADRIILPEDMLSIIASGNGLPNLDIDMISTIEIILSWTIGLRNLKEKDEIIILWKIPTVAGLKQESQKQIQAISLRSSELKETVRAYAFGKAGEEDFFDRDGRPWKRSFLRSPVRYGRISSQFNLSRFHPVLKKIKAHRGTDFAAPEGAEIYSIAAGEISKMGSDNRNGKYISVTHDSVFRTTYLHMKEFHEGLEIGSKVIQGQIIGKVGSTGLATGPHVCLRFYRSDYQGDFVSAFPYLPKPDPMPLRELKEFLPHRDRLDNLMNQSSLYKN